MTPYVLPVPMRDMNLESVEGGAPDPASTATAAPTAATEWRTLLQRLLIIKLFQRPTPNGGTRQQHTTRPLSLQLQTCHNGTTASNTTRDAVHRPRELLAVSSLVLAVLPVLVIAVALGTAPAAAAAAAQSSSAASRHTSGTTSSSSDSLDNTRHQHPRRSLQGFTEMICLLDPTVLSARRNNVTGDFAFVDDDDDDDYVLPSGGGAVATTAAATNDGIGANNETDLYVLRVKRCPCASFDTNRYCPADLAVNTCIIRHDYTRMHMATMTCMEVSNDDFIRSLPTVIVLVLLVLSCFIYGTPKGKLARQYSRRLFQCGFATRRTATAATALLRRDLDMLLEQEPGRAALLYRLYRLRERDRLRRVQVRRESWWYRNLYQGIVVRLWQCLLGPSSNQTVAGFAADNGVVDTTSRSGNNHGSPLPESAPATPDLRPRLTLKTKVYQAENGDEAAPNATSGGGIGALSLFSHANARDAATLDEMDNEMEHGDRCAICLSKLRHNDVIGDIYCRHAMHKDCLKDWLQRKNTCPLCQQTGIAVLTAPTSQLP